jgi:SAM-dependent methyltransferase
MTLPTPQQIISAACEEDLATHGDTFRGVGYTKSPEEATERYALMLEVVRETDTPVTILDLGCGLGHMLDFIEESSLFQHLRYVGLDISTRYLAAAKARHPQHEFLLMDVLSDDTALPVFDYVILNGVFNYRGPIAQSRMVEYWEQLTSIAYRHCRHGIAFNVMSKLVDWEREELFHLPFDVMAGFVWKHLSRHFVIRHDYQAFEYTTYVYRQPFTLTGAERRARPD